MKFTQIPTDTFQQLQMNAGILVDGFDPATGTITTLIGATSGGINATATPTYTDFGDDIDNCPKNMLELKKLDSWEAKITGTFVTVTVALGKRLIGAADIDADNNIHIVPRNDVLTTDFKDLWWIGDYSDKNGNTNGGFCAIHLLNALSTTGFAIQSGDKAKGTFSFEFTGHYSMANQDKVPFEVYIQEGDDEVPVEYEYVEAELTDGFEYGVTYYTRSGSVGSYVYTEVTVGAEYDSETTYYIKQVVSN